MRIKILKAFLILLAALFAIGAIVIAVYGGLPIDIRYRRECLAMEIMPLEVFVNPHADFQKTLKIRGKQYRDLRGQIPYYIEVPSPELFVFVVSQGTERNSVAIHFYNTGTGETTSIDAGNSSFGWGIGNGRKNGEKFANWIEVQEPTKIVLAARGPDYVTKTLVNLETRAVEWSRQVQEIQEVSGK